MVPGVSKSCRAAVKRPLRHMRLVGPRPELDHVVARYAEWQHIRHQVTVSDPGAAASGGDAQALRT